ncbi:hypothetical protein CsatB_017697 [Cannabis sativa]|uniref:uncharacterized protein LOC115710718 n=1 Tax=Cannabis sativa TaxID=3483 RepID=UPI0011E016AB|nr:uncharacterized protein LOC115710718 [Cannabis sativa]
MTTQYPELFRCSGSFGEVWTCFVQVLDCLGKPGANRLTVLSSLVKPVNRFWDRSANSLEFGNEFMNCVCMPMDDDIKREILNKSHATPYSVHPETTKMYQDLKPMFWWLGIKNDIAEYPLNLPEWKWEDIAMDFMVGLPRTTGQYDSVWVIVGRFTKSTYFLPIRMNFFIDQYAKLTAFHPQTDGQSERTVQILEDMLQPCMKHFGKKGKLMPRIIGPFKIPERIGHVAYRLAMPPVLAAIDDVFNVLMLQNYLSDPSHILSYEALELQLDLSIEEQQVQILDR